MMRTKKIRILLVDDHPLIRSGLKHTIDSEEDMCVCGEASNVEDALAIVKDEPVDIVIADISLENSSGIDLIRYLHKHNQEIPVLVISVHDEPGYIKRAFQSGARGYLLKRESVQKVPSAIRQVLKGETYADDSLLTQTTSEKPPEEIDEIEKHVQSLSKRESEIFHHLGDGKNRKEIADLLNISLKTVETHIDKMKPKLNVNSGFELIHFAIKYYLRENQ